MVDYNRDEDKREDGNELVEFPDSVCVGESQLAIRVMIDGHGYWIPKSLIHDDSEVYKRDTNGVLIIPRWLAEEKRLV